MTDFIEICHLQKNGMTKHSNFGITSSFVNSNHRFKMAAV